MECYCDNHLAELNNEDLLLDDKNTLPLLNDNDSTNHSYCKLCRKLSLDHEMSTLRTWDGNKTQWENENITNLSSLAAVSNGSLTLSDGSSDSPLLVNESSCSDITIENVGVDNFHCHLKLTKRDNTEAWKKIIIVALMCFIFMIAELIGGHIAGSLAVMTDAAHLLSDFIGFLLSLSAIAVVSRSPTKQMTFGYYRAEILGALFSIVLVWMLTVIFMYFAVMRVVHQDFDIEPNTMMIVSGIGVIINIVMGVVLHGFCKNISHNHNHSLSTSSHENINVRAAFIHVLGDLIQSIGVFIAALIIKKNPTAKIIDPICTFLFSILVIFTTKRLLSDSVMILMEGFPCQLNYNLIYTTLKSINGVRNVHSLQVWALTTDKNVLTVHLAVDSSTDKDDILKYATTLLIQKFKISFTTIQVETFNEVTLSCSDCKLPPD